MSRIIAKERLTAFERWELPSMEEGPPRPGPEAGEPAPAAVQPDALADAAPVPVEPEAESPAPALPTLEEIEAIQREAQEEGYGAGYETGYRAGHEEGMATARSEIEAQVQRLQRVLDFMSAPLAELDAVVEDELSQLAVAIAQQLLRRELKTAPGEIVAVVRNAVGLLPVSHQQVAIQLHPEDARLVKQALSLDEGHYAWRVMEDPGLTRGGCVVTSDMSRVDATLEKRLNAVIASVLGDEREVERGGA